MDLHKRLALVIGSGGVMCAASIGLWKVLQRQNIELSMAVGCSGGSIYAAAIALGFNVNRVEEMTLNLWNNEILEGYTSNLRAALSGENRFTELSGLADDERMLESLRKTFGDSTFADTRLPLYIVSTDLYSGEKVLHTSGKIIDALRASSAIPMIFAPWKISDRFLVDGAVSDPLPVDVAIKEGMDIILAMGFELPTRNRMRSYTAVTAHFNSLYMNNILKSTFAFYNAVHHAEIVPILPEFDRPISGFDGQQIPYIIEEGERAAHQNLPYLQRLLANLR